MVKRNFKEIHALDPSASMLMKAKKKNVYKKFLCEFVNPEPSPTIDNGKQAHVVQHIDVQWQIKEFQNRGSGPSTVELLGSRDCFDVPSHIPFLFCSKIRA